MGVLQFIGTLLGAYGAVGRVASSVDRHIVGEQWAVELLAHIPTLLGSSGQWDSFCTLPLCLQVVGSWNPALHRHSAWEQWAMELVWHTARVLVPK